MNFERNCLSHWFPKLAAAGLPVPKTMVVEASDLALSALAQVLDCKPFGESAKPFFADLREDVGRIGLPCFLRTGQTSGKHRWRDTCYLTDVAALELHVAELINFSEQCGFLGVPWNVWCVRELLPTKPVMLLEGYGGMPLCREWRCFVDGAEVICVHPYWPLPAIRDGVMIPESKVGKPLRWLLRDTDEASKKLRDPEGLEDVKTLASRAGAALGGHWSVDILDTERGWFVTDCAVASDSFHWEGCENASRFVEQKGSA
jgi:hypothetical protein